jgi:hypothetical protein
MTPSITIIKILDILNKSVKVFFVKKPKRFQKAHRRFVIVVISALLAIIGFHPGIFYIVFIIMLVALGALYYVPDDSSAKALPKPSTNNKLAPKFNFFTWLVLPLSTLIGSIFLLLWIQDTNSNINNYFYITLFCALFAVGIPLFALLKHFLKLLLKLKQLPKLFKADIAISLAVTWDGRSGKEIATNNIEDIFKEYPAKIAVRYACWALKNKQLLAISPSKKFYPNIQLTKSDTNIFLNIVITKKQQTLLKPKVAQFLHNMEIYEKIYWRNLCINPGLSYTELNAKKCIDGTDSVIHIPCFRWHSKATEIVSKWLEILGHNAETDKIYVKIADIEVEPNPIIGKI